MSSFESKNLQLMHQIVILAGLFHDLGKSTVGFQEKLYNYVENSDQGPLLADPLRHELVSYLMLTDLDSDEYFIDLFTNPDKIKAYFTDVSLQTLHKVREDGLKKFERLKGIEGEPELELQRTLLNKHTKLKAWQNSPILCSIQWLVSTHHKTTNATKKDAFLSQNNQDLVNGFQMYRAEAFTTYADAYQPWDDHVWLENVSDATKAIKEIIDSGFNARELTQDLPMKCPWIEALSISGRESLVFADYIESKYAPTNPERGKFTYANTRSEEKTWGDPLHDHLNKVGSHAGHIFYQLHVEQKTGYETLPSIKSKDYPTKLMAAGMDVHKRFLWQSVIINGLKAEVANRPSMVDEPFFGSLISRTGSGKTRMGPAIMASVNDELRISLALGRRALTVQSFKAYSDKNGFVGFGKKEMALLVGEMPPWLKAEMHEESPNGTDSVTDMDSNSFVMSSHSHHRVHTPLSKVFHFEKEKKLLSAPVSVMTVDHMVKATYLEKSSDLKLMLHLRRTDLILDEIDDYSEKDMIVLGKLIYLSGYFGRKVLIASATLPEVQVRSLYESFYEGVRTRSAFMGNTIPVNVGLFNDLAPYMEIIHTDTQEGLLPFEGKYRGFVNKVCDSLIIEDKKHRTRTLEMPSEKDNLHLCLLRHCYSMHDENAELIVDGIKISIGFVRFNNVIEAQRFAKFLNELIPETHVTKTLCYHARMLGLDRHHIEHCLDTILDRNKHAFESHKEVKNVITEAKLRGLKDATIIISTTSIQETGRDHDYDWCIVEPLSSRSLIQSAGRVWRHRSDKMPDEGQCNIGVLERSIATYEHQNLYYAFPGVESPINGSSSLDDNPFVMRGKPKDSASKLMAQLGIKVREGRYERMRLAKEILHKHFFEKGVDASPCLKSPESYCEHPVEAMTLARMAHCTMNPKALTDPVININSMNSYLYRSDTRLNNFHCRQNQFRHGEQNMVDIYADPDSVLKYRNTWQVKADRDAKTTFDFMIKRFQAETRNMLLEEGSVCDRISQFCIDYGLDRANDDDAKALQDVLKMSTSESSLEKQPAYHSQMGLYY